MATNVIPNIKMLLDSADQTRKLALDYADSGNFDEAFKVLEITHNLENQAREIHKKNDPNCPFNRK